MAKAAIEPGDIILTGTQPPDLLQLLKKHASPKQKIAPLCNGETVMIYEFAVRDGEFHLPPGVDQIALGQRLPDRQALAIRSQRARPVVLGHHDVAEPLLADQQVSLLLGVGRIIVGKLLRKTLRLLIVARDIAARPITLLSVKPECCVKRLRPVRFDIDDFGIHGRGLGRLRLGLEQRGSAQQRLKLAMATLTRGMARTRTS